MRRRFFVDGFDSDSATVHGDTAKHLGRVLRAKPGQLYELSDGREVWLAHIERVSLSKRGGNRIDFALVEAIEMREPALQIHLLLSIVKFDRFEWCLEKATELGVTEITPLAAARTDKALIAAAGKRRSRWEKILLESAQQARRVRPPILHLEEGDARKARVSTIVRPADALAHSAATCRILLSERTDSKPIRDVLSLYAEPWAALAIGPEGGWTDEEFGAARAAAFIEVSLGENILRTETAAVASLAILRFALGD